MDDGSASVEESIAMLRLSQAQGVCTMVATPHFYPTREDPRHFLSRRERAWQQLRPHVTGEMPRVLLGAEVYYFTGISDCGDLDDLCIQGTRVLLLEMPFHRWSRGMVEEVLTLAGQQRYTLLMAHIDRYLHDQPREVWNSLSQAGVLFQVNADAFLQGRMLRWQMLRLLKAERIAAIASDCHNMENRRPNLEPAAQVICDRLGKTCLQLVNRNSRMLLNL